MTRPTRDETIRALHDEECPGCLVADPGVCQLWWNIERAYDAGHAAGAAEEREACADLVARTHVHGVINPGDRSRQLIEAAIRARGKETK